jgi:hypothetical protein
MMGIFGGLFGGVRVLHPGIQQELMQDAYQPGAIITCNGAENVVIFPPWYYEGMQNNRRVECAYCRTPRMSMHKECKSCGASEVMK